MNLDGVALDFRVERVKLVFELCLRQQLTRARQKRLEQGPLARRQRDRPAVAVNAAPGEVDVQRTEGEDGVRVAAVAPRNRADPGREFCKIKGFHQIIVGPRIQPFDLAELSARIGSVARRYAGNPNPIVTHGALAIDLAARSIHRDGRPVTLTAREWALFEAFLSRPGQLLSKAQLEDKLYAFGSDVESNTIEVHVSRLRKKLGAAVIETERGLGYRLGRG